MFRSVLIANRGEIAVRIIRGCRELGLETVAVYSEADRLSPHVALADRAVCIGPPAASESYLVIERLLEAARSSGAGAIHPGYGFLAERELFARAVEDAGLVFIGPTPETIAAMGSKTEARRRMQEAGVPIVPGVVDAVRDAGEARRLAEEIGFPVLLKAAAGGGGKGMRVVEAPDDIERSLEAAMRESQSAFGDDAIYLEKFLDRPRHIEIQVLGDEHGTIVHLGERECSIQRRHQKLVEEAPSGVLTAEQREAMGEAAVRAAAAVRYRGAGTVEFLFQDGDFYFLEMNTRLQVEHPVTELVTGIDLVHAQLRVAMGEPLGFQQSDVRLEGHAIECRITAENPDRGFLPSTGTIEHLEVPDGPGIRWDGGVTRGSTIGLHYDPLIGKLIASAPTREEAIDRMAGALSELAVVGMDTCTAFHRRVMAEPDFRKADLSIGYLEDHPGLVRADAPEEVVELAALAAALLQSRAEAHPAPPARATGNGRASVREGRSGEMSAWRASGWPWSVPG